MRDVIVALPHNTGLQELAKSLSAGPFEVIGPSEGRLAVRFDGEVVQLELDQSLSEHYEEPQELALLNSLGHDPNFFLVNFKSTKSLGNVLARAVDRLDALVDNDFGLVESGRDFVQRFRENPDWDWVRSQVI